MFGSGKDSGAAVPPVPDSLRHDAVDINNLAGSKQTSLNGDRHDTAGNITPYLGLRSRLSQLWINRWTVLLILVLARTLLQLANLNVQIDDAKSKALESCTEVENIGSAMASMPHYLSVGVNQLAAEGMEKAVNALVQVLFLILTGVEELILFILNMYVGTYACLITAVVHGGLEVAISAVDGAVKVYNSDVSGIADSISNDIKGIQDTINNAFGSLTSVANAFGGNTQPPQIDISGPLNDLKNIKINDTQFLGDLTSLNHTLPTFDQVENFTKNVISIPFDDLKQLVNNSYAGWRFDQSVFPVAQKQALTFCSNNSTINDFFDAIYSIVAKAKIIFIVIIVLLAILACVAMAFLEIRRYRKQQRYARYFTKFGYDWMDIIYIASRPFTATAGIFAASRFHGKRQVLVRWCVAYGTSLPAIFVLSLAMAGFFSCLCQFIILTSLRKEAPVLAAQVGNFANEVVHSLEGVSQQWANDANGVINGTSNDINQNLLGWVRNATSAVNDTLNAFDDQMSKALNDVFQNTPLQNTINDVVGCLITRKVDAIEKGLTWVHDNAHVSFPLFPADIFATGAQSSITSDTELTSFLASPGTVTSDDVTGAIDNVTNMLHYNLVQEALISTGLLLAYVIVVLIGIVRMLMQFATPDRMRGEGGQRFYTGDGRPPVSPRVAQQAEFDDDGTAAPAAAAAFPRFGKGRERESIVEEMSGAAATYDEKRAMKAEASPKAVRAGKGAGYRVPGHWRKSSHGDVEIENSDR